MEHRHGKVKIHRLNGVWTEASLIWPKWFGFQGEDESLVLNYFITWRFIQPLNNTTDNPAVWIHMEKEIDKIIIHWMMIKGNVFVMPKVKYFSLYLIQIVLDSIWKSNYNITVLRRFGPVLDRSARDIECAYQGGFQKLVHVRLISQVSLNSKIPLLVSLRYVKCRL